MVQALERIEHQDFLAIASYLAQTLALTAAERDRANQPPCEAVELLRQSGLLKLIVPREYGGHGETDWVKVFQIVRELAKADGSVAQLFGNHIMISGAPKGGTPDQQARYFTGTVQNNWFWANAANALDTRLQITEAGNHYRLNGIKSFCTGVRVADAIMVGAVTPEDPRSRIFVLLPSDRPGIHFNDDWDYMGQRQTDSVSVRFESVFVAPDEVLPLPPDPTHPAVTLRSGFAQLVKVNTYLGIALGALEAAQIYTRTETRPWITAGIDRATRDPFILRRYGEYWSQLQAAIVLADEAAEIIQTFAAKGNALTANERAAAMVAVFTAKAYVTQVGIPITSQIFETLGSRATARQYGFDRYWRDLRVFTLHDPVSYKVQAIGDWTLNRTHPPATAYS